MYLTNVEAICRRFVDEKRESLLRIKETAASFKAYWASQSPNDKKALVQHKGSDMLKVAFTLDWSLACLCAQVLSQQAQQTKQARLFMAAVMSHHCKHVNRSMNHAHADPSALEDLRQ